MARAPVLGNGTQFNDQGQFVRTARNFAGGGELRWETYYDQSRIGDRYDYVEGFGILDNRDEVRGDWISSQLTYSHTVPRVGLLTVGLSGKVELWNVVENVDYSPDQAVNLDISHPDRTIAPFAQQEWNLAQHWTAYLGARFDVSHNYGSFLSPRVALVYQPATRTSFRSGFLPPGRSGRSHGGHDPSQCLRTLVSVEQYPDAVKSPSPTSSTRHFLPENDRISV
jgi:outer membrane receptor protein involved in Fe transport